MARKTNASETGSALDAVYHFEPQSIAGWRVLVSGGTTGLGRAIALRLVSQGANVLIYGRHREELDDALADLTPVAQEGGGRVFGVLADQSKSNDIEKVFKAVDSQLGGLDVLINNAGLAASSVLETEPSEFEYVLKTNLLGYLHCARLAAERMKKNPRAFIINVGSMSAKSKSGGSDIYVATKNGIRGFSISLGEQLNEQGIRVTLIEPGLVGSDMTAEKHPPRKQPKEIEKMTMLRAEDIAECVHYLLTQPQRVNVEMIQIRPTKQAV